MGPYTRAFMAASSMPDLAEELRAEPARIPNFIPEVMRLESPVQFDDRIYNSDFAFLGRRFSRGWHVRL
jgi:cytochrome P450